MRCKNFKKRKCIWFDETCTSKQYLNLHYHYFPDEVAEDYELLNAKGLSGHFAGAAGYHFKSELGVYNKKLNSDEYQRIIEHSIVDQCDQIYGWNKTIDDRNWELYQDGDSAHQSASSLDYMESRGIRLWRRCAWSPDMAAIEYIWSIFWMRIAKRRPKSNTELIDIAKKVWDEITLKEIQNVIDHMDTVYKYIIDTNGEYYTRTFKKF